MAALSSTRTTFTYVCGPVRTANHFCEHDMITDRKMIDWNFCTEIENRTPTPLEPENENISPKPGEDSG